MIKTKKLKFPLFSSENQTYLCPILGNKDDFDTCFRLAEGWRYFKYLKIIQNISGKYFQSLHTTKEFLELSKEFSNQCSQDAETLIENLVKKRKSILNIDCSRMNLMGVINLTPDSFFEQSRVEDLFSFEKKIATFKKLNIDILDVGGESSRPGSKEISSKEEFSRIEKYLKHLNVLNKNFKISLDSRNYNTIKKSLKLDVKMVNDISGVSDERMISLIAKNKICLVLMHMQKRPENMQLNPNYDFAPVDIYKFFKNKINLLVKSGMNLSQIIIDPGFGFGKTLEHNLHLLKYLPLFHTLGVPLLVGLSRKKIIENISQKKFLNTKINNLSFPPEKRLAGSIALNLFAYQNGAQFIRTHDVLETLQSIYCIEEVDIKLC